MSSTESLYTDAQANEILRTAVRLAAPQEITFEEFAAAASELGISREELQEAEAAYNVSSSEEGIRAEFARMQHHEFLLSIVHVLVLLGIAALILLIDFKEIALPALAVGTALAGLYLRRRFVLLRDHESEKNLRTFEEWKSRRGVWLRPEQAKQVVDSIFVEKINRPNPIAPLKEVVVYALRLRLGYDKKRANAVYEAYVREHPEVESLSRR